jgi:nucleoside-diphosphate-sugar epimerase
MRVLVTGSSGRVGAAIVARLARAHAVTGVDRVPGPRTTHVTELRNPGVLDAALADADAVVHTAALHVPHVGVASDAQFEADNVELTASLIESARRAGVARVVYTSTTALYGHAATPDGRAGWVDEDLVPQPCTIYHRTKLAAEALLRRASDAGFLDVVVLRMSRCFPEPAPLMAQYRLHRGIDARDVADAHALALDADLGSWACFVVSSPTPFERGDAEALWHDAPSVLRSRAPALAAAFDARDWPLPARIDRVYDPAAALRHLGWQPRHGFEDVLAALEAGDPEVLPADAARDARE